MVGLPEENFEFDSFKQPFRMLELKLVKPNSKKNKSLLKKTSLISGWFIGISFVEYLIYA